METTLWLTPEEAAAGAVKAVPTADGPISVGIPPVTDGAVLSVPTASGDLVIRVRVGVAPMPPTPSQDPAQPSPTDAPPGPAAPPAQQPPFGAPMYGPAGPPMPMPQFGMPVFDPNNPVLPAPPAVPRRWYRRPVTWIGAVVAVLVVLAVAIALVNIRASGTSATPIVACGCTAPAPTSSPVPIPTNLFPTNLLPSPKLPTNVIFPSLLAAGQCLSGPIPSSATPVDGTGFTTVDCGSPTATYKILQVFQDTTDLSKCGSVSSGSAKVYAFAEDQQLAAGITFEAVYCAVSL